MKENTELATVRTELKSILKKKSLSYRAVAKRIGVSEITVKRFFTAEDISFQKLQQICRVLDLSVFDLFEIAKGGEERSFQLDIDQEKVLCSNEALYDCYVLLLKYRDVRTVENKLSGRKINLSKHLNRLEKLGLIEQKQSGTVELKHSGTLTWIRGGPLQEKFMRVRHLRYLDVFEGDRNREKSYMTSSQRFLLPESLDEMKRDLEFVVQKFRSRAYREEKVYPDEELQGVAWLVGVAEYENHRGL